ncbi:MAG: EAL domain-containing protein, partial [Novosphingobium sp.]
LRKQQGYRHFMPDRIAAIFAEHGAREDLLEVEVTETSMMADPGQAESIVRALHNRGIAVALDDFGTGFSSLSHLQACPVDTIKIDRSFVQGVGDYGPDQKIVLGIIGLARSLGVETVAEGVELESQRRWLAAHECDTLQGYVISRPLRFEDYCALLRAWPKAA